MEFHLRLQFYSIPFLVETPSLAFSTHSLLKVPNSRIIPTLTFQFQSPDLECRLENLHLAWLACFVQLPICNHYIERTILVAVLVQSWSQKQSNFSNGVPSPPSSCCMLVHTTLTQLPHYKISSYTMHCIPYYKICICITVIITFLFMRIEVSIVVTELFTRHTYWPKGLVSFGATLITSSSSIVVEMTLPFLIHEILLVGRVATISCAIESGALIVLKSWPGWLDGNCSWFCTD